ncbi:RcpC/CpaB family pilus assembly protein [Streptomyces sp. NPDC005808]|uniref:RcpC/CpaB family pilus assembly protein n=1 Tax=Streptomyces sp. NPDC005808 TaxID=3364734 RepID=UPI0036B5760E
MKIQERTGAGNNRSAAPVHPAMGERLPAPPRERKPALAALAVLLILVGALGATMLVLRAGDRIEVVQVTDNIQAGDAVNDSNMTSVLVAADSGIRYVKWSQRQDLKTYKAKSPIYAGTVVIVDMFTKTPAIPAGKASVGLALKEGQYPDGIQPGDVVAVYRVSGDSGSSSSAGSADSTLIVDRAEISDVKDKSDSTISSTSLPVTLTVDSADAAAVAQASSAGEVALVLIPSN